jgi:hypothetical protein
MTCPCKKWSGEQRRENYRKKLVYLFCENSCKDKVKIEKEKADEGEDHKE